MAAPAGQCTSCGNMLNDTFLRDPSPRKRTCDDYPGLDLAGRQSGRNAPTSGRSRLMAGHPARVLLPPSPGTSARTRSHQSSLSGPTCRPLTEPEVDDMSTVGRAAIPPDQPVQRRSGGILGPRSDHAPPRSPARTQGPGIRLIERLSPADSDAKIGRITDVQRIPRQLARCPGHPRPFTSRRGELSASTAVAVAVPGVNEPWSG